jgi:hypothetical protein
LVTAIRPASRPAGWVTAGVSALRPQKVQQRFPGWAPLRDDLLATNQRLISYVGALESMIARPNALRTRPSAFKPKRNTTKNQRSVSGKLTSQPT